MVAATDTYPQFAIRYGDDYAATPVKWGSDAGTIMGTAISKAGFVELTGSSTKVVTLTTTTAINLYGFGYNEDRSGFGAGQITVAGQVTATRVG